MEALAFPQMAFGLGVAFTLRWGIFMERMAFGAGWMKVEYSRKSCYFFTLKQKAT